MPKFQNLNEAFWHIRENPLEYLPEKSLALFYVFWWGYQRRYEVEFKEYKGFELLDGFHDFMKYKFKVPSNRGSSGIAQLYSQNQADAFDLWFACLEEFISKKDGTSDIEKYYSKRRETDDINTPRREVDFFELSKSIFKIPASYVGSKSFTLVISLLLGWMRATKDFGFKENEQEKTFEKFQGYIEDRPFGLRANEYSDLPPTPTWNKIILFWTGLIPDEEKALEMFAKYFDEFAFQGKGYIEYVEFHWKIHLDDLSKWDQFTYGKFLRRKGEN